MFAQFRKAAGHTHDRSANIVPTISVLLNPSRPNAICRRVRPIVVFPFKSSSGRNIAHIRKKVGKIMPPFTYLNAPTAVVSERFALRIIASLFHGAPEIPQRRAAFRAMTMTRISGDNPFSMQASTGRGIAGSEGSVSDSNLNTASANTKGSSIGPSVGISDAFSIRDHFKPSKLLSDQRDSLRHGIGDFNVVFSGGSRRQPGPLLFSQISEMIQQFSPKGY